MTVRILVTGSRHWTNRRLVHTALAAALEAYGRDGMILTHGHCPTGADHFADEWGQAHVDLGVVVDRHPADWTHLGRAAGPARNEEMVQLRPDLTLAFLMPDSRGTKDCVRRVVREKLPLRKFHSGGSTGTVGGIGSV